MEDTILEKVNQAVKKATCNEINEASYVLGISTSAIFNLRYGKTKRPRHDIIQKLHDHFCKGAK